MIWVLGLLIIAAAVYAIARQFDVRLVLTVAGLALGALAGQPMAIVRTFLATFSNERFVIPLCTAMGFAYVLRLTECDRHLVQLLVKPLRRARPILIPGAVLVGFLVNIPVVSQTSTAVAIGAVLVPLLRAAGFSAVTTGAALLLGSSLGGELLNPAAPELLTVAEALKIQSADCVEHVLPLLLVQLAVATPVFWFLCARAESQEPMKEETPAKEEKCDAELGFRVNLFKALVPLVPVTLLFLAGPPLKLVQVPRDWFVEPPKTVDAAPAPRGAEVFESRQIGAAMLVGVVLAAMSAPRKLRDVATSFFEGAGYAFARIIGIIVAASCFGEGIKRIGLATAIGFLIDAAPILLIPVAGVLPMAFGWLCGSGMATTQALFEFFVAPAKAVQIDAAHVGAVVSIASAAGRTMSPVAAVTLMSAALTETNPLLLVRRVAVPLLIAMAITVIVAIFTAPSR
ncbi:MAG: C4-dicarboxylate transporter DcuC [Gemmataceae bacterium]|nr:C4-dicarboxylate transporter DcuC [Gemmataceae bacterium]